MARVATDLPRRARRMIVGRPVCHRLVFAGLLVLAAPAVAQSQGTTGAATSGETPATARLAVRMSQIEQDMQATTGKLEDLDYQIKALTAKFDRLAADLEMRLGQAGGAAVPAGGNAAAATAQVPTAESGGPRVLGQVPAASVPAAPSPMTPPAQPSQAPQASSTAPPAAVPPANAQATAAAPPAAQAAAPAPATTPPPQVPEPPAEPDVATTDPTEAYAMAFAELQKARYDEAERGFKQFLSQYPDDRLASNARYWLGETYYVRGDYRDAAEAFLDTYEHDRTGPKAADSLLKLGMALANLDKPREACASFAKLLQAFPNAPAPVRSKATQEQRRLDCS